MSEESATIEALAPYPQELDQGYDECNFADVEWTVDDLPASRYVALHDAKSPEEFLIALGNWHRYTEATLDGLKAKYKPFIEQMESDLKYLQKKLEFIESCINQKLGPGPDSRIVSDTVRLAYSRSERVEIVDSNRVPFDLCKTTVQPDVAKIKEVLKSGGEVPGAELVERWNLQIKPGSLRAISAEKKRKKQNDEISKTPNDDSIDF